MQKYITKWLGLDLLCAELTELGAKASSARSQLTELTSRLVQLEAKAARHDQQHLEHAERVARTEVAVDRIGKPTRYIQTPTGLQQI